MSRPKLSGARSIVIFDRTDPLMSCDWTSALSAESSAQNAFLELLNRNPQQAYSEYQDVRRQLVEERLLFGDKPVPMIFPPFVLSGSRWAELTRLLDRLNTILARLNPS